LAGNLMKSPFLHLLVFQDHFFRRVGLLGCLIISVTFLCSVCLIKFMTHRFAASLRKIINGRQTGHPAPQASFEGKKILFTSDLWRGSIFRKIHIKNHQNLS
jgi:hypothetical protein